MIANSAELKVAARNLKIMEEALRALRKQLAAANPRLFEVTSKAYVRRIQLLQTEIAQYLGEHPAEVSLILLPIDQAEIEVASPSTPMRRLDQVRGQREAILRLAANYGARNVRLFGSVARGEERPDSDLDVLVDFEPDRSLLDQVGFEQDLEDLLGFRVEVVEEGGLSPYLEAPILQEAIPL